jgi:hypothetical protein
MSSYVRVGLRVAMFFVLAGAATILVKPKAVLAFDACSDCVLSCNQTVETCLANCRAHHELNCEIACDQDCLAECTAIGKCS